MRMAWLYQRKWLLIQLPVAVLAIATLAVLWLFVYPMPPDHLSITSAGKGGAYHRMAQRYAEVFANYGVQLEVQLSEGSQENIERLSSMPARSDLALMQGGFGYLGADGEKRERSRIETLANVDTEAIWIFSRNRTITSLNELQGLRVAIGASRSGNHKVAMKLFEQARLDMKNLTLLPLMGPESVNALAQDLVDVVITVIARESTTLKMMLGVPGIHLANLQKTAAITERNRYLESSLLAQGALDADMPTKDTSMLTMSTSLVAREGLHPALQRLAVAVAMEVNSKSGLFHRSGDYPSLRRIDFPTASMARTTLAHGLPWHERLLPFWWAQFAERVLVLVLPVLLLAMWLMHTIPSYLRCVLQSRVNRWYGELKFIENDISQQAVSGLDLTRFLSRLNRIDASVLAFACPEDLMARCFTLHQHIKFVRQRLYRMRGR